MEQCPIRQRIVTVHLTVEARGEANAILAAKEFFAQDARLQFLVPHGGITAIEVPDTPPKDIGPAEMYDEGQIGYDGDPPRFAYRETPLFA